MITIQNIETVLSAINKVEFYPMKSKESDFSEAQRILEISHKTENIDAESAYNERVPFEGLGTYEVKVESKGDYIDFKDKLVGINCIDVFREKWAKDKISDTEYYEGREKKYNCKCEKCTLRGKLTFEHWKTGVFTYSEYNKYLKADREKSIKLGKYMTKIGVPQEIIDFYSAQVKDEKTIYLTISDKAEHIAGMAYYSDREWDGYNGTSCQDVRWSYGNEEDGEGVIQLAGSLHDDKLFIAFTHDSLDDLEDMEEKMLARTILRYMTVDGVGGLFATSYYGNNNSKDALHKGLAQLAHVNVFNQDITDDGIEVVEPTNGFYNMYSNNEVYVCETVEHEMENECPTCDGYGHAEYEGHRHECLTCEGNGMIYSYFSKDIEEWIEVEVDLNIEPYAEGYSHFGERVRMNINIQAVERIRFESKQLSLELTM